MSKILEIVRNEFFKLYWRLIWSFGVYKTKPIHHTMHMGIHRYSPLSIQDIQDYFGCFDSYSWQFHQLFYRVRNPISPFFIQCLRIGVLPLQCFDVYFVFCLSRGVRRICINNFHGCNHLRYLDQIGCLTFPQTNGFNQLTYSRFAQGNYIFWTSHNTKKMLIDFIDLFIGCLGTHDDCNQQLKRRMILQLTEGIVTKKVLHIQQSGANRRWFCSIFFHYASSSVFLVKNQYKIALFIFNALPLAQMIIQKNVDLSAYTTFHFPCTAETFFIIQNETDLELLRHDPLYQKTDRKLILWWWANILLATEIIKGIVIKNEIKGKQKREENDDSVLLDVWSGENRDDFVWWTIDQWRAGLENLVSIPWTVWAAPVQNIWAYGSEAKDTIVAVTGIDMHSGEKITYTNEQCHFSYRNSLFKSTLKDRFFITSVQFRLSTYHPETYVWNTQYEWVESTKQHIQLKHPKKNPVRCIASAIAEIRATKLPDHTKIWTAWSFFQNPLVPTNQYKQLLAQFPGLKWRQLDDNTTKLSAGQLIELVWLKWYTKNNVWVYEKHALILVHHGNWHGKDLQDVIELIITSVQKTFQVTLVPEVSIIY